MEYQGSCHCGKVTFAVEGEIKSVTSCNCSICQRKAFLGWFVSRQDLRLLSQEGLTTYTFNRHSIQHHFCSTCGIHPYGEGRDTSGNPVAAINVRCIDGLDLASIPVNEFDGRAL
jgi:hypothetical protein